MSLTVGTGGVPVFMPANGAAGRPFDTLFGLPLIWNRQCKTLGTVGDIVLCDWSQYLVGLKAGQAGMQMATSIHIKFDYLQTAFRFSFRMDGQPWWKQALQPPESEKTLSPFITLATRA
jgi:HK97 family phage major capsid protein